MSGDIKMPENKGAIKILNMDLIIDINKLCNFHNCDDITYCKYCALSTMANYKKWKDQQNETPKG